MERTAGVLIVAGCALAGLALAFVGRTRLSSSMAVVALAACGAGLGIGGVLIEGETGPTQAVAATVLLAVLTPLHVRVVLGPLGRKR